MSEYKDYGWEENESYSVKVLFNDLKKLISANLDENILDVGCGNGSIANKLIIEGYSVYGIDASESGIKVAKKTNEDKFFVQDINSAKLPVELQDKKFDLIISTEVIEHLYNPRGYIEFCKNVLLQNGGGRDDHFYAVSWVS